MTYNIKLQDQKTVLQNRQVLNALPFYVLLVDEEHHILFANKATKLDLGLKPEEIIGKYCPKVVHGADGPIPECPLEESVKTGKPAKNEFYDSEFKKWYSSAIYPINQKTDGGKKIFLHMVYDISKRKQAEKELKNSFNKLQNIIKDGIRAIIKMVESRDPYTAGHQQRVGKLAFKIARRMNLSPKQVEGVHTAGLIHDIGKIAVPTEILCKPGKINKHEFNIIKSHPQVGYNILKDIDFPWPIAQVILQHHERLNGSGYPQGLKGDKIIPGARIIAVADVVEAMCSHRPYRPSLGIEKALREISNNSGVLYDAEIVEICVDLFHNNEFSFD